LAMTNSDVVDGVSFLDLAGMFWIWFTFWSLWRTTSFGGLGCFFGRKGRCPRIWFLGFLSKGLERYHEEKNIWKLNLFWLIRVRAEVQIKSFLCASTLPGGWWSRQSFIRGVGRYR
jgi:hypothetical protein